MLTGEPVPMTLAGLDRAARSAMALAFGTDVEVLAFVGVPSRAMRAVPSGWPRGLGVLMGAGPRIHAGPAVAAPFVNDEVAAFVGVSLRAVREKHLLCRRPFAAKNVDLVRNRLQVIRVAAGAVAAEMVERQIVRDRSAQDRVDEPMHQPVSPADADGDVSLVVWLPLQRPTAVLKKLNFEQNRVDRVSPRHRGASA